MTLAPLHVHELAASGVPLEIAKAAGLYSEPDPKALEKLTGWPAKEWASGRVPALVIPYRIPFQRDHVFVRVKPARPFEIKNDEGKARTAKYVQPKGEAVRLYYPPGMLDGKLHQRTPLIITEGEKKALAVDAHGFRVVALSGVSMWHRKGERKLHPDFAHLEVADLDVFIAFDHDALTNRNVRREERSLGFALLEAGARVFIVRLPADAPKLDDFIVKHGAAALAALLESARVDGEMKLEVAPVSTPGRGTQLTDLGNGERLAMRHGGRFRHCEAIRKSFVWTGQRWAVDETGEVYRLAQQTIRGLYSEAAEIKKDEERRALVDHARKSEARARIDAMVGLARSQVEVAVRTADFDRDPWLLNTPTGTADLRTGEVRPHVPGDLITKLTRASYVPSATCVTWERFVLECMGGDRELAAYLQRSVGYSLTGDVREHCLFFLYGAGANGKGTFVNTLVRALGDYAKPGAPDLLLEKRGDAHPTEVADLFGARLVSVQEVEQGRAWAESTLKSLTGGDPVKARRMREDFWTFEPTHKFWVSGNHKPRVRGTDDGIWRRMRLIPFEVSFKGREDRLLGERLAREVDGILGWAVRGCLEWQRVGLAEPERVRSQTEAYRRESDGPGEFIAARCVLDASERIAKRELRQAYEEWCADRGENPVGAKRFAESLRVALAAHDLDLREVTVRHEMRFVDGWAGLRLATDVERAAARNGLRACGGVGGRGGDFEVSPRDFSIRGTMVDSTPTAPHTPTNDGDGPVTLFEIGGAE